MAINRSKLVSSSLTINSDRKTQATYQIEHRESNLTFSKDENGNTDLDLEHIRELKLPIDSLNVGFDKASSTAKNSRQRNSGISTRLYATSDDEQVSDEKLERNISNKDRPSISGLTFQSWFLGI